jgi:hypothetical protein
LETNSVTYFTYQIGILYEIAVNKNQEKC